MKRFGPLRRTYGYLGLPINALTLKKKTLISLCSHFLAPALNCEEYAAQEQWGVRPEGGVEAPCEALGGDVGAFALEGGGEGEYVGSGALLGGANVAVAHKDEGAVGHGSVDAVDDVDVGHDAREDYGSLADVGGCEGREHNEVALMA